MFHINTHSVIITKGNFFALTHFDNVSISMLKKNIMLVLSLQTAATRAPLSTSDKWNQHRDNGMDK